MLRTRLALLVLILVALVVAPGTMPAAFADPDPGDGQGAPEEVQLRGPTKVNNTRGNDSRGASTRNANRQANEIEFTQPVLASPLWSIMTVVRVELLALVLHE